ncbi:MAG: response regulator [Erysipelotrichaceae bacterium]|nr:response regulator [Erysipelotrichaceae bacterium]
MKNEPKKIGRMAALVIAAGIVIAAMMLYIGRLELFTEQTALQSARQIAVHDLQTSSDLISDNWMSLKQIAAQIEKENPESEQEIDRCLSMAAAGSDFTDLFLVTEDGTVYSSEYTDFGQREVSRNLIGNVNLWFKEGQKKMAARFDLPQEHGLESDSSLVYGILTGNMSLAGKKVKALLGAAVLTDAAPSVLTGESAANDGTLSDSGVIDSMGRYVMIPGQERELDPKDNIYTDIEQSGGASISDADLAARMEAGEAFSFIYKNGRDQTFAVVCLPFEDPDIPWYQVTRVEYSLMSGPIKEFLTISCLVLFMLMAAFVLVLVVLGRRSTKEAKAAVRAEMRLNFLTNMSHEIRNPLNGLIGLIHLMRQDLARGADRESLENRLEKADGTASYIMNLVNNILDFSKMQKDKAFIMDKPVSVHEIAKTVWDMQYEDMEAKDIHGSLSVQVIQDQILADDLRLKQVLTTLLSNAVKFNKEGGEVVLSVSQKAVGDEKVETTFVIKDTGIGMSPDFTDQIWNSAPDEQVWLPGTEGAGLGLAITKQLLDAMKAKVQVISAQGVGTVFTIVLVSQAAPELSRKQPEPDEASAAQIPSGRILVAEDNEFNAEILTEILEEKGFETAWAKNGEEAVEIFRKSQPGEFSAILMDMKMPEMDGCQAAQIIRSLKRPDASSVTILACTASIFMEEREKAINSGMDDFLSKPVDPDILLQKLGKKRS